MQNLYDDLKTLFGEAPRFVSDGEPLKNKIVETSMKMDAELIKLLLSQDGIRRHFFTDVDGVVVFDTIKFQRFVMNKEFLPDNYTAYKIKIGLTDEGKYLSGSKEVVLAWPYKDCVLEGGQTEEDAKRNEVFWNETLAPDQITQLLAPKVLVNFRKYEKGGKHKVANIRQSDNLIIKGNNLLALHTLKKRFFGKIKLIYIDPPYNTGGDSFLYNDKFKRSTWLTFMKNRLTVARELLHNDGVIFVQCDDNEQAYLKVLMDEIFGQKNFVNNIIWHKKNVVQNDAKFFSENHDFIVVFAKNKLAWRPNLMERTVKMNERYDNPDNDPRGEWTSVALQAKSGSENDVYEVTFSNGISWKPVKGTYPRLNKKALMLAYDEGRLWFGKKGRNVPRLKKYLNEVKQGLVTSTVFKNEEVGSTQKAKEEIKELMAENIFKTPKPENLIKRIIEIATNKGDIVLDYHLGSGTTAAVAHKMGRQYIGVEQMDYIETIAVERIKKVIIGEQGGISETVNWQGGGSFVYCELSKANQTFIDDVESAKTTKELETLWNDMQEQAFLIYKISPEEINLTSKDFQGLSLEEQKLFLIATLDKNMLYIPYAEINDKTYGIAEEAKNLNRQFHENTGE